MRNTDIRRIIYAVTLVVMAVFYAASAPAKGEWRHYTAFDCQPHKIMDGNRFTYVWVLQNYYNSAAVGGATQFLHPRGGILFYDREDPGAGMRDIRERGAKNPTSVRMAAYNTNGGYLLIIYNDGGIEILTDEGTLHTIDKFRDSTMPVHQELRNITFSVDDNDAWVATSTGFFRIDGSSFRIGWNMVADKDFNAVCRVGSRLIAIFDNALYQMPYDGKPHSIGEFEKMPLAIVPQTLMPMSDGSFMTMYKKSGPTDCLAHVGWNGGTPKVQDLVTDTGFSNQLYGAYTWDGILDYQSPIFLTNENNVMPIKEGYLVFSLNYAYKADMKPASTGHPAVSKRKFAAASPIFTGSYDFENFWFYKLREGFHLDKASGFDDSTSWTEGPKLKYAGPLCLDECFMDYSPAHGLVMSGCGKTMRNAVNEVPQPMLLGVLRNGGWKNADPMHNRPDFLSSNPTLAADYDDRNKRGLLYPMGGPLNLTVDETFPNYVWAGSFRNGAAAVNLNNPTGQILHLGNSLDWCRDYPGYKNAFPTASGWYGNLCHVHTGGTDAEGNMWFLYHDYIDELGDGGINLFYLTADDRRDAMVSQDISKMPGLRKLRFNESDARMGSFGSLLTLKHPDNKNKHAIATDNRGTFVITDHNGTMDDTSDDIVKVCGYVIDSRGGRNTVAQVELIAEDPVTGKILVASRGDLFAVDPSGPCINNEMKGDIFSFEAGPRKGERIIPNERVRGISFDEFGRCWLGIENGGVVCVSADRSRILARYNTRNSPIPSDNVTMVGWNQGDGVLVISTDQGVATLCPDLEEGVTLAAAMTAPAAYPSTVRPDFAGSVTLTNIPAASQLAVIDKENREIMALDVPREGISIWNLHDASGNRVSAGKYRVVDRADHIAPITITVLP